MFVPRSFDFPCFFAVARHDGPGWRSTLVRRLILLQGAGFEGELSAPSAVRRRGNYVVGVLIFIILTARSVHRHHKGATRTASGRQVTLDDARQADEYRSDLSNGVITEEEAQAARRDPQGGRFLRGDGRSLKFVRGDVKVGIVIIIINIIGGFIIGMVMRGEPFDRAAHLLSIGDGLVAQIPAPHHDRHRIIVTRAVSGENLGDDPQTSSASSRARS